MLLYALWFQWAIGRYLAEKVMDDEQSIIASRQQVAKHPTLLHMVRAWRFMGTW